MNPFASRIANGVVFFLTGAALLATSPEPTYSIEYSTSADLPAVQLDNARSVRRIRIRVDATQAKIGPPETATAWLTLSAIHSDPSPQTQANNSPWVTTQVMTEPADSTDTSLGGALGATQPEKSAPFLETSQTYLPLAFSGSCEKDTSTADSCIGEAVLVIERAATADDSLVTTVTGTMGVEVDVSSSKNGSKDLAWTIEFFVEETL